MSTPVCNATALVVTAIVTGCVSSTGTSAPPHAAPPEPMRWSDVQALAAPEPGHVLAYGAHKDQFGELRVPPGPGPHAVVVVIHGGCWLEHFDYGYMRHMAHALTQSGLATWTIEYRRVGGNGGWPLTLTDVADAIDYLREIAHDHRLDLSRVVAAGHSAGGHLALWSATRARLGQSSDVYRPSPLRVHGVLGLAPIADLAGYRVGPPDSCHSAVLPLMGGPPDEVPVRYFDASPAQRLPLKVPVALVSGREDPIVALDGVIAFADAARRAGDRISVAAIAGAGHFEPALPHTAAWPAVQQALRELVGETRQP